MDARDVGPLAAVVLTTLKAPAHTPSLNLAFAVARKFRMARESSSEKTNSSLAPPASHCFRPSVLSLPFKSSKSLRTCSIVLLTHSSRIFVSEPQLHRPALSFSTSYPLRSQ